MDADSLEENSSRVAFSGSSDWISIVPNVFRFSNSNGLLLVIRSIDVA